jgi:hypothetical protein
VSTDAPLIHFDDFLNSPEFPDNLRALTQPLGEKLGLTCDVDELGVVCVDVPALVRKLEADYPGIGPFFMGEGSPAKFSEDGRLIPYKTRVAFGYYRGVLIELAEPGVGSDLFQRAFDPARSTIHHLGYFARGDELSRSEGKFAERLRAAGFEPHVRALVAVLGFFGRVTIFDSATATSGVDIEFLDFRLLGERGIYMCLPAWLVALTARLQRALGKPILELPSK